MALRRGCLVHADLAETAAGAFAGGLLGPGIWKPDDVYRKAAARADSASGYYNYNIKIALPAGPVMVRIPIPGSDIMDLSIWPESSVLRTIRDSVTHAPRLLYANKHPRFQVLEFIHGELLDVSAPRGVPVPGHVIDDVAEALRQLCAVPRQKIPALPEDWPADGKSADFARRLSSVTASVYARFQPDFAGLFTSLGIPPDPLALARACWQTLRPRPFRLLH